MTISDLTTYPTPAITIAKKIRTAMVSVAEERECTMFERITIGLSVILAGLLLTWVVVNAEVGMKAPDITNETWLNSTPLHLSDLKGKVVMVEFWTFGCYNCRNVEPYVKQWHQKYTDKGS